MIARTFSSIVNACFAAMVVGAALPGTHRVLAPQAYGLSEIAPRVWSDAPQRTDELLELVAFSKTRVSRFFGDAPPNPTLILCATKACAQDFGIRGNGLSIADMAVMVAPGGLTRGTLTHEMTHSRLHRAMGLRNIVRQPFPTWFDEGLATHVADHPRWNGQITREHRVYIRNVQRFWQWRGAFRKLGVGRSYIAAAMEVDAIERRIGRAGLLELIARAEAGERFDGVLEALTGQ
ncbi:MAG: hypothetical protein ABJF50_14075 [Paracoccaceae bacterium]